MAQLAFQRLGNPDPWVIEGPLTAATIYLRAPQTLNWKGGAVDVLYHHKPASIYATGLPDLTAGTVYLLFAIQGLLLLWLTPIDNVPTMDAIVNNQTWGPLAWVDESGIRDYEQY